MKYLNMLGIDIGYVVMGLAGCILIILILLIVLFVKHSKLKKKYNVFMSGKDGQTLEEAIRRKFETVDKLENDVKTIYDMLSEMNGRLVTAYQKVGIVKYDAFKELGGKLSFVLVLLTDQNNGFILNSVHSTREGCYTYMKSIENGECEIILSEEEKEALDMALSCEEK